MSLDVEQLREVHERAAYLRWEEAYGAYEVARDEASAAWTVWVTAIAS